MLGHILIVVYLFLEKLFPDLRKNLASLGLLFYLDKVLKQQCI